MPEGSSKEKHPKKGALLAVVIVTYNSADVLQGLLDSIPCGCAGVPRFEVIVVDNQSCDASVRIARAHPVGPTLIIMGRNAGYAAAINAAAAQAGPDADLLVLNPDIRLSSGAVAALYRELRNPGVGVAAPRIVAEDGRTARSLRREPSLATIWSDALLGGRLASRLGLGEVVHAPCLYARGGPVEWATGAALLISAEARRRAGGWDESFFLYSEEVDYLRRVRQSGLAVHYVPQATVLHIGGAYEESSYLSGLMTANRIRDYGRRHGHVASGLFRLAAVVGEALRLGGGPVRRATLRAALAARDRPVMASVEVE
jgi:GT2 family glycosyltransferase